MDDFFILVKTRHGLSEAIELMHKVLVELCHFINTTKRFISKSPRVY